jgi:ankyrin repeat protein
MLPFRNLNTAKIYFGTLIEHNKLTQELKDFYAKECCSEGKTSILRYCITEVGACVDGTEDESLLHVCIRSGQAACASLLIDLGANIYSVKKMVPFPPLSYCCKFSRMHGVYDIFKSLVEKGAPSIFSIGAGASVLHHCVFFHSLKEASLLLESGCSPNVVRNEKGFYQTPIYSAIASGSIKGLSLLIHHGADVDFRANDQSTPLFAAVRAYDHKVTLSIVKMLVSNGADVHAVDNDGHNLLYPCLSVLNSDSSSLPVLKYLLDEGVDFWTCKKGIASPFLVSIDVSDISAFTSMLNLCKQGDVCVKHALCAAVSKSKQKVINLILSSGKLGCNVPYLLSSTLESLLDLNISLDDKKNALLQFLKAGAVLQPPVEDRLIKLGLKEVLDQFKVKKTSKKKRGGGKKKVLEEESGVKNECVVCLDQKSTHAFIPCGHLCVCEGCKNALLEKEGSFCPVCMEKSTQVLKIFICN